MNFLWPWVFLLFPLPIVFWFRSNTATVKNTMPVSPRLAQALDSIGNDYSIQWSVDKLLAWLCWLLLLVAIAQPGRPDQAKIQPASGRAIAMVIDLSGSMERDDFTLDGETANRLTVVKKIANQFIAARAGDRISLVLYASDAFIAAPLTFDLNAVQHQLSAAGIGMAGRSTAIGDALGLALQTLSDDPSPQKAIVLLSDGANNAGAVEPESAATLAAARSVRVHTIALGSTNKRKDAYSMAPSADLDEATLQDIAASAGGVFFRAKSSEDLAKIYAEIDQLESAEVDTPPIIVRRDLRHWPLIAVFLGLLLRAFLRRRQP